MFENAFSHGADPGKSSGVMLGFSRLHGFLAVVEFGKCRFLGFADLWRTACRCECVLGVDFNVLQNLGPACLILELWRMRRHWPLSAMGASERVVACAGAAASAFVGKEFSRLSSRAYACSSFSASSS